MSYIGATFSTIQYSDYNQKYYPDPAPNCSTFETFLHSPYPMSNPIYHIKYDNYKEKKELDKEEEKRRLEREEQKEMLREIERFDYLMLRRSERERAIKKSKYCYYLYRIYDFFCPIV